jgi:hypothetical protein
MKTTLLLCLCLVVALTGCTSKTQSTGATEPTATSQTQIKKMDSPIIISDGSTRLKHKGANGDFQITYNASEQVTVNDSGYSVGAGECTKGVTSCPPSFMMQLVAGWTLDVFDAGGTKIMTVSSQDNVVVATNFYGHSIDPEHDGSDGGGDTNDTNGTEIIQHDFKFKSASFTNGGGAAAVPITCTSSPCKLKIQYSHP